MNFLLTSDTHFVDSPLEDYRWKIFDTLHVLVKSEEIDVIVVAGDCLDRKDKHSALLVNRLVFELEDLLVQHNIEIDIILGNHDAPLSGLPFWSFLDSLRNGKIRYIQSPTLLHNIWFMPFCLNPETEWKDIDFSEAKAAIIHQTISGAVVENNRVLETNTKLPKMKCKVFSGDVHRSQTCSGVTYIGAPYPVRFGEDWEHRVIVVKNDDFENYVSIPIDSIKRTVVDIQSTKELPKSFKQNDQVRIRYRLSSYSLADWSIEQNLIRKWAQEYGVNVLSVEAVLAGEGISSNDNKMSKLEQMSPEDVIRLFAQEKQLDPAMINMGIQLAKESI